MYTSPAQTLVFTLALGLAGAAPAPWGNPFSGWSGSPSWSQQGGPGSYGKPTGLNVQVGPRPYYLVDNMSPSPLKTKLQSCSEGPFKTSTFSISHRGAPLMFPEHSRQAYNAAARMGAGIIECDVAFTKDRELVCRHSQCDLQYTTNVLAHPDLAAKCTKPFTPYDPVTGTPASATCCTSDFTLQEFKSLCAEMEGTTFNAVNVSASGYFGRIATTPDWRTNMYAYSCAEPMSLKEQIALVGSYGLNFTAEAKTPPAAVPMPFEGTYTQADFAQQIVDTFKQANIPANRVWLQSFLPDDIFYWLANDPAWGAQAIYLDERADLTADGYQTAVASLPSLAAKGVKIIGPSIWQLIAPNNATGKIVPSSYAIAAKKAGLEIITWSFDRSGPLENGGGYYYTGVNHLIHRDGDEYVVMDVIAQQVGASRIFADWPGVATYYANCFGL